MIVSTFGPVMERVHMPTFIGYCCFMGCIIANIVIASVLCRVGTTSKYMQIFVTIFAYQNHWNKLISTRRPKTAVKSIDGVRAISMMWVMIAHLWGVLALLGEQRYALDALKNGEWSFITNGYMSVDRPVFTKFKQANYSRTKINGL